jgi:hypothetical protein
VRIEHQRPADDGPIAAVFTEPERVAEDDARLAAAAIVGAADQAAERRLSAEQVEERAADDQAACGARLAAVGQVEPAHGPGGDISEALLLAADLLEDRVVDWAIGAVEVAARAAHVGDADARELGWPRDGERSQAHGIHDLEDGGRRPDAEREREDRDERESRAPAQQAGGVSQVLRESGERDAAAQIPGDLLHDHDVAELAAGRGFRLGARLAALHAFAHRHLEVRADLLIQLVAARPAGRHASLPCRPPRMPPMASTKRSQRERPDASSSRPLLVRR